MGGGGGGEVYCMYVEGGEGYLGVGERGIWGKALLKGCMIMGPQ